MKAYASTVFEISHESYVSMEITDKSILRFTVQCALSLDVIYQVKNETQTETFVHDISDLNNKTNISDIYIPHSSQIWHMHQNVK